MLRGNEFFYEQDDNTPQFIIQTTARQIIRDPKLFTMNPIAPAKAEPSKKEAEKNKPVVLAVSICCSSCVDIIESDFRKVTGIKTIDCDIYRNKVTVTGTATLADVLSAARRHFKDAAVWDD
ncbi:unnamed protein product [Calypogeia fissa]